MCCFSWRILCCVFQVAVPRSHATWGSHGCASLSCHVRVTWLCLALMSREGHVAVPSSHVTINIFVHKYIFLNIQTCTKQPTLCLALGHGHIYVGSNDGVVSSFSLADLKLHNQYRKHTQAINSLFLHGNLREFMHIHVYTHIYAYIYIHIFIDIYIYMHMQLWLGNFLCVYFILCKWWVSVCSTDWVCMTDSARSCDFHEWLITSVSCKDGNMYVQISRDMQVYCNARQRVQRRWWLVHGLILMTSLCAIKSCMRVLCMWLENHVDDHVCACIVQTLLLVHVRRNTPTHALQGVWHIYLYVSKLRLLSNM